MAMILLWLLSSALVVLEVCDEENNGEEDNANDVVDVFVVDNTAIDNSNNQQTTGMKLPIRLIACRHCHHCCRW